MLREIQWYNIATKLREFIASFRYNNGDRLFEYLVDRDDMKIRVGSGNTGEWPALWIIFGSEDELEQQDRIGGATIQLWLDFYVKAEASSDFEFTNSLYNQLFRAEQEMILALRKFDRELHKRGIGTNMRIDAILSDGDDLVSGNSLNTALNRMVLTIDWRKARN